MRFADGSAGTGRTWSEDVRLAGAEALATFAAGQLAGKPAIASHRAGKGTAIYVATQPDAKGMARILDVASSAAGVSPTAEMPKGVEVVRRSGRGKSFLFVLNHRDVAVDVPISQAGENLIDGRQVHSGLMRLGARDVAVIRVGW